MAAISFVGWPAVVMCWSGKTDLAVSCWRGRLCLG